MGTMEQTPLVKELSDQTMSRINGNATRNSTMEYYFLKMLANGIVKKRMPPAEIGSLRSRMKRYRIVTDFG